jgi:hypothetical protein
MLSGVTSKEKPVLLSGGNPQIAKGDGGEPLRAFIAAMPEWKQLVGQHLDSLIAELVPEVKRAVRWNSPFYGVDGRGWFLSFHCLTKYVKVTFFAGTSLSPQPTIDSKDPTARFVHITEADVTPQHIINDAQLRDWITQASQLDGWHGF